MFFCPRGIRAAKLTFLRADPFAHLKFSACFGPQLLLQTFKSEFYAKPKLVWHAFPPLPWLRPTMLVLQQFGRAKASQHRSLERRRKTFLGPPPPNPPAPPHGHDFWRYSCMESMEISIFQPFLTISLSFQLCFYRVE